MNLSVIVPTRQGDFRIVVNAKPDAARYNFLLGKLLAGTDQFREVDSAKKYLEMLKLLDADLAKRLSKALKYKLVFV